MLASLLVTTETESTVTADEGGIVSFSALTTTDAADCFGNELKTEESSEDLDFPVEISEKVSDPFCGKGELASLDAAELGVSVF
jgi:hypothetical protein